MSRGHHWFAATSFKPSITNACSATLRLSLAFSAYSCLSEWAILGQRGRSIVFYLLFPLAVTAAVQLVGVFLVFASLIIPALAIRHLRGARALITGYALGAAGYALGLVLSALFDLPSGGGRGVGVGRAYRWQFIEPCRSHIRETLIISGFSARNRR